MFDRCGRLILFRSVLFTLLMFGISLTLWADDDTEPKLERKKKVDDKDPISEKVDEKKPVKEDSKKKIDEKKVIEEEPSNPINAPEEIAKIKERIIQNATDASKRLSEKDPGNETQKLQADVLKDIDDLLKQAQNQQNQPQQQKSDSSSSPSGGQNKPMGGGMSKQQSKSGDSKNRPQRQRRSDKDQSPERKMGSNQERQNGLPMKENQKESAKSGSPMGGSPKKTDPKGIAKVSEVYKDVWGHLPEKLRQEMDLYYREQFMPRYTELLREYYSSLAQQKRKSGKGD